MRKLLVIFLLALVIELGLFIFLYISETCQTPNLLAHLDFIIWNLIGGNISIWILLKISSWLNKVYSWKTSFGKRFFSGFAISLLVGYLTTFLTIYIYVILVRRDIPISDLVIQYKDAFSKALILLGFALLIYSFIDLALYSYNQYATERLKSLKLHNEQISLQYNALKNQLSSHFLFNSLNSISSLIYKNIDTAENYIRSLTASYKLILEKVNYNLISLAEELEIVNNYKFLMEVRFEGALFLHIHIADKHLNSQIPPLSIQLLVENAIKHNLISEEQPLNIKIESTEDGYVRVLNNCIQKDFYVQIDNKLIENPDQNTTMIGLNNIKKRYGHYTNRSVEIKRGETFQVKLPVLTNENERKDILT